MRTKLSESYFDNWERLQTIHSHFNLETQEADAPVLHTIFDREGKYILTASVDKLIKIYDRNLTLQKTIKGHQHHIGILALSSNNKYIVSADESSLTRVWTFPEGESVAVLTEQLGHEMLFIDFYTETIFDPETQEDVPWKAFLITVSPTGGLIIYEDKHISKLS